MLVHQQQTHETIDPAEIDTLQYEENMVLCLLRFCYHTLRRTSAHLEGTLVCQKHDASLNYYFKIFNQLNFFPAPAGDLCCMENIENVEE
ncbi:hypothetical protein DCC81_13470 [Chitinophaga parva]|uniref:Uncharacterized protein n=1 Tax=Chitinophaga parva TaxID=2169414 RepID=A0A2T7BGA8_9BACT|nr:hypothetical protein DCC81_13470 [Chitinophaga parva]